MKRPQSTLRAHFNDADGNTAISNIRVESVDHAVAFAQAWNLSHSPVLATVLVWQSAPVMAIIAHRAV